MMRISSLGYMIKQGCSNIRRNKWFSLASFATMTACIFLFGLFFCLLINFRYIVDSIEEGVGVTVFFEEDLPQEDMVEIGKKIQERPEVTQVVYVSGEEAWQRYQERYFKDSPELAEGFEEDNPLIQSSNYEVYVEDIEHQNDLVGYIEGLEGVRRVNQSETAANAMTTFNVLIGYVSMAVITLLLMVSIFLISNTVSMGITVRQEEIGIMKMIGARDGFIKAPFIIEGILIGLAGSIVPLVMLLMMYRELVTYVLNRFSILAGFLRFLPLVEISKTLIPAALMLGMGIGLTGSWITVRKQLHKY